MFENGKLALLATLLVPSVAMAQVNVGDTLGTSETVIRAALEAQGYSVKEFETEDGEFEIHATLDGTAYEIEVSAETGVIQEIELDDEGESDDS